MQCKLSIVIYNRVSCIGTSLKSYNDIRLLGKHVCDLTLSFIAPVGANYCFYHIHSSCVINITHRSSYAAIKSHLAYYTIFFFLCKMHFTSFLQYLAINHLFSVFFHPLLAYTHLMATSAEQTVSEPDPRF